MKTLEIYDTTLRDGAQMRGISFSVHDKLRILEILDDLGIAFVEGGWPGANPKDIDFFEEAKKLKLKNTVLTAFGSTRKANTKVQEDPILQALLRASTEAVCIVGKSSAWQVETTLSVGLEQNLAMLAESIEYLRSHSRRVFVDAEHFFDGCKSNLAYAKKFIETAIKAGAETMVLCDTNGGGLPEEIYQITKDCVDAYGKQIKFGIHVHNDGDLAVANSIQAIQAGAIQVQGTINGYGERCGNANLISVIANLQLKYPAKFLCVSETNLYKLTSVSKKIAEIANMNHSNYQPFVGASAFTHKGGLHASAMKKEKTSYEHIDPNLIGNTTKIVVSEQSGISNILEWLEKRDLIKGLHGEDLQSLARDILARVKKYEHRGYSFENADASFELLARKTLAEKVSANKSEYIYPQYFELIENNAHILNGEKTEATVRIRIGDVEKHSASLGNGPANALDNALRKALKDYYPEINNFQLKDFKVRILDSHLGTGAITKVQITTGGDDKSWDTVGVSPNIIKASWDAIVDSIEYGLMIQGVKP